MDGLNDDEKKYSKLDHPRNSPKLICACEYSSAGFSTRREDLGVFQMPQDFGLGRAVPWFSRLEEALSFLERLSKKARRNEEESRLCPH